MRFSTPAAIATSVACRPSVRERSPSPMTRFHLDTSDSTRARRLYPDARRQPMRPRSAMTCRWPSRWVGAVPAVALGTALERGGTMTAASGWRAATAPMQRDRRIEITAEHGRMGWQKASGYNRRALIEADIARWKRVIGDGLRSPTDARQAAEVAIAVGVLNRMLELGRPESVRVA